MSRTTTAGGLLVGMLLAGVALVPASGTFALLSDRASVESVAGAAELSVEASPVAGLVLPEVGSSGDVQVTTTGELPWSMRIEPIGGDGAPDCDVAARLGLTTTLGTASTSAPVAGDCPGVLIREGSGAATGAVTVQLVEARPEAWTGVLHVSLQQQPGGFSDVVDVPLQLPGSEPAEVATPPASGGSGSGGSGSPAAGRPGAVDPPSGSGASGGGQGAGSAAGTAAGAAPPAAGTPSQAPPSTAAEPPPVPSAPVDDGSSGDASGTGEATEQTTGGTPAPDPSTEG